MQVLKTLCLVVLIIGIFQMPAEVDAGPGFCKITELTDTCFKECEQCEKACADTYKADDECMPD